MENRVERGWRRKAAPCVFGEAIRASGTEAMAGLGKAFKPRQSACELDITGKCGAHVLADMQKWAH